MMSHMPLDIAVEYCKGLKDREIMVPNGLIVITIR